MGRPRACRTMTPVTRIENIGEGLGGLAATLVEP
jgi:hypothetical protein